MTPLRLGERLLRHRKDNRAIFAVLAGALVFFSLVYYLHAARPRGCLGAGRQPRAAVRPPVRQRRPHPGRALRPAAQPLQALVERRTASSARSSRPSWWRPTSASRWCRCCCSSPTPPSCSRGRRPLFRCPVRAVLEQGNAVAQELTSRIAAGEPARRRACWPSSGSTRRPRQRPRLRQLSPGGCARPRPRLVLVYQGTRFVHAVLDPNAGLADLPEPGRRSSLTASRRGGDAGDRATGPGAAADPGRQLVVGGRRGRAPARHGQQAGGGGRRHRCSTPTWPAAEQLVRAYQAYRQLEVQKPDLRASYMLIFLMVTLLILLASSWVGLYLARRVTVPIQALAEGTRRVAGGDLAHRVEVPADDELGVLVDSFNRMTEELGATAPAARGQPELSDANRRLDDERGLSRRCSRTSAPASWRSTTPAASRPATAPRSRCCSRASGGGRTPARGRLGRRRAGEAARAARRAGGRKRREVQLILGGEWKTFEVGSRRSRRQGAPTGQVLVLEDLTELIQAQQLATWNEAARRVAHEIKNPLTPIRLAAERVAQKVPPERSRTRPGARRGRQDHRARGGDMKRWSTSSRASPACRARSRSRSISRSSCRDGPALPRSQAGRRAVESVTSEATRAGFDQEQLRGVLINLLDNAVEATRCRAPSTSARSAATDRWCSRYATAARASPPKRRRSCSSPTTPPRAAAPASASPSCTASSPTTAARSGRGQPAARDGLHHRAATELVREAAAAAASAVRGAKVMLAQGMVNTVSGASD